ncbi:MAG: hypothetical protein IJ215_02400 [Clostridia bacterium]|nr:hypothetical protein [Clostridia bacterium]
MRKKVSILTVTLIVTIIVFIISTYMQKQLINYEPTIKCLVLKENILANEAVLEEKFELIDLPLSFLANTRVIQSFSEIEGLYAKDDIYKGQIAVKEQFDTKERLSIFEAESGKEKISIKIQSAEHGASYTIKQNSFVNVYATIRSDYAQDFLMDNDRLSLGDEYDGYTIIKLLDSSRVIGTFNIDGMEVKDSSDGVIDSIMLAVNNEEAKQINLLREIANFNVTGVNPQMVSYDNPSTVNFESSY